MAMSKQNTMPDTDCSPSLLCTLGEHPDSFSTLDAIVNASLFPSWNLTPNSRMRIVAVEDTEEERHQTDARSGLKKHPSTQSENVEYVFKVQHVPPEVLAKHPRVEISLNERIARTLGFRKRVQVRATIVQDTSADASHVEITFRDVYLTRADMWRLVVSELAGRSLYRGQRLYFLNSIKAQVNAIYQHGETVQSAFFVQSTKPIFRSESARYVIFVQMSREMWDFDTDGSGEIMFQKVIDGFLPELFQRWDSIGAHHLVSIVLFTRMEYESRFDSAARDRQSTSSPETPRVDSEPKLPHPENDQSPYHDNMTTGTSNPTDDHSPPHTDFYRVLVSDVPSSCASEILSRLKQEYRVFLRDVSTRPGTEADCVSFGDEGFTSQGVIPEEIITGSPSLAVHGNILEAINMASSQFSVDYVDRDLSRTGLSIIVITPGPGVFHVDADLMSLTTNMLIENGIGIDLVSLTRMPLHSVPLFRYRRHRRSAETSLSTGDSPGKSLSTSTGTIKGHDLNIVQRSLSGSVSPLAENLQLIESGLEQLKASISSPLGKLRYPDHLWISAIPHWLDISFWSGSASQRSGHGISVQVPFGMKRFVPRVRMYDIQMMGIMENELSDLAIPHLTQPWMHPRRPKARRSKSSQRHPSRRKDGGRSSLASFRSRPDEVSAMCTKLDTATRDLDKWMTDHDENVGVRLRQNKELSIRRASRRKSSSVFAAQSPPPRSSLSSLTAFSSPKGSLADATSSISSTMHSNAMVSPSSDRLSSTASPLKQHQKTNVDPKSPEKAQPSSTNKSNPNDSPKSTASVDKARPKIFRHVSFGLRGFKTLTAKAAATAELSVEMALPESYTARHLALTESTATIKDDSNTHRAPSRGLIGAFDTPGLARSDRSTIPRTSESDSAAIEAKVTTPIAINAKNSDAPNEKRDLPESSESDSDAVLTDDEASAMHGQNAETFTISPRDVVAPWMTVLNPSNPKKVDASKTSRLGRWHHVFPRKLRPGDVKWKSLCSPASVPLTTEDLPTKDQLSTQYKETHYDVRASAGLKSSSEPVSSEVLARELIGARFSQGFQNLVGPLLEEVFGIELSHDFNIFDDAQLVKEGASYFMVRGSYLHRLSIVDASTVHVTLFERMPTAETSHTRSLAYEPRVRTMLGRKYAARQIALHRTPAATDWRVMDAYIADSCTQPFSPYPDAIRSYKARFVLVPDSELLATKRQGSTSGNDNAEEIRLEGIGKLTQMWQRHRYVLGEEQRFKTTSGRQDVNPLDIIYRTQNPAAIVAAELHDSTLVEGKHDGQPSQLLPEKDRLERSELNLATLGPLVQGDQGVNMMDRRWHFRVYYNCFIGFDMTTWLLENFRDVDTREAAVDLGNELMKEGFFTHVRGKHDFRDGNYFYQISHEFRSPRKDAPAGWFGKMSMPTTPLAETMKSLRPHSSSGSSDSEHSDDGVLAAGEKRQPSVVLSKRLTYDVDPRRRSYRRELVTLHYDRISSADDCYHLRLDWVNVTPKLIEDAIESWSNMARNAGLRIIQLPIREASAINQMQPFREPYKISLAVPPPVDTPVLDTSAMASAASGQRVAFFYHKELLKHFHFTLDLEAAKDFPASVDVSYSWGKPDYQYSQYVSSDGVLLAQITDEGDFLLLANRLCNLRGNLPPALNPPQPTPATPTPTTMESSRTAKRQSGRFESEDMPPRNKPARPSSVQSPGVHVTPSSEVSPAQLSASTVGLSPANLTGTNNSASPGLLFGSDIGHSPNQVPYGQSVANPTTSAPSPHSTHDLAASIATPGHPSSAASAHNSSLDHSSISITGQVLTEGSYPEYLVRAFETFCHDGPALTRFYAEKQATSARRPGNSSTGPATPLGSTTPLLRGIDATSPTSATASGAAAKFASHAAVSRSSNLGSTHTASSAAVQTPAAASLAAHSPLILPGLKAGEIRAKAATLESGQSTPGASRASTGTPRLDGRPRSTPLLEGAAGLISSNDAFTRTTARFEGQTVTTENQTRPATTTDRATDATSTNEGTTRTSPLVEGSARTTPSFEGSSRVTPTMDGLSPALAPPLPPLLNLGPAHGESASADEDELETPWVE